MASHRKNKAGHKNHNYLLIIRKMQEKLTLVININSCQMTNIKKVKIFKL